MTSLLEARVVSGTDATKHVLGRQEREIIGWTEAFRIGGLRQIPYKAKFKVLSKTAIGH